MKKNKIKLRVLQILEEEGRTLKWASKIMKVKEYEIITCCQNNYCDLPSKSIFLLGKKLMRNYVEFFEQKYGDEDGL